MSVKKLFFLLIFLEAVLRPGSVLAQYLAAVAAPTVTIDKLIGKPGLSTKGGASLEYVDNLGMSDFRFKPRDDVFFQLKVKNSTDQKLENITIQDFIPPSLDPIEGPGSFDEKSRIVTISVGAFAINEEKIYTLKMRVFPQDKLPSDKGLFCEINKAEVRTDKLSDDDTSQFCVEKQVTGVQKVPSAGPEAGLLLTFGEGALLGVGIYLANRAGKRLA